MQVANETTLGAARGLRESNGDCADAVVRTRDQDQGATTGWFASGGTW